MQKKMTWLLLFSFLGLNFHLSAQDSKKKAEFEAFKKRQIAFISQAMNLTDNEAKIFWPLCNEFQAKKFAASWHVRKLTHEYIKDEKEGKHHSEEEYSVIIKQNAETRVQEAKLEQEYIVKFAEIIPAGKVFLYLEAERQFARKEASRRSKK
ncbi:MAG: hypothetical protein LBE71_00365 [Dysgonamonadaceae bacterium]|jgi:ATP-dependent Lon protease|nr:hypothetical protein [Dysgonamonadaceae bacterium]